MKLNYKNYRPLMWLLFALGVVFCLLGTLLSVLAVPGFILFAAAVALQVVCWRCPHCGRRLPARLSRNESCPSCGRSLF